MSPLLKSCAVCGAVSDQARCPAHRYTRARSSRTHAQRRRVLARDGYRCQLCGRYLSGGADSHIDHIRPLSKGGSQATWDDSNVRATCKECNERKGSQ
jgi:5-methylcytosine-specific restriction endonuclease McrA